MNQDDKEFLQRIWDVLGYDTSEGARPIHEQFYERHKDIIDKGKQYVNHRDKMKSMTDEERKEYFRIKNREKLLRHRRKNR